MLATYFAPVTIEMGQGHEMRTIATVSEAAQVLTQGWPGHRGKLYAAALDALRKSGEGYGSPQSVRAAFVKAARESDILIHQ